MTWYVRPIFGIRADFSVTDNSAGEMKTIDTGSRQTCNTGRGLSCEAVRSNSSGAVCCWWDVAWLRIIIALAN